MTAQLVLLYFVKGRGGGGAVRGRRLRPKEVEVRVLEAPPSVRINESYNQPVCVKSNHAIKVISCKSKYLKEIRVSIS